MNKAYLTVKDSASEKTRFHADNTYYCQVLTEQKTQESPSKSESEKKRCLDCNSDISHRRSTALRCEHCAKEKMKRTALEARLKRRWLSRVYGHVSNAVKAGKLPHPHTQKCVDCGRWAQVWDHRDYNKPLDVEPVCRPCNYRRGPAVEPES